MPRKAGGSRRKRRTHHKPTETPSSAPPHSFVLRRGKIPAALSELIPDIRQALMPYTAANLRERRSNSLRDYVSVAAQLNVKHFWLFSATSVAPYLRLATVPQGPTLTFRIDAYTPAVHVRAAQRRPVVLQNRDLDDPALLVLNNFGGTEKSVQLVAESFRQCFPPLDVNTARLGSLRRVLLVNRDVEKGVIYLRHYVLKVVQAGLSRPVRKMVTKKRVPKLAKLENVAQMMEGGMTGLFSSDSEMEGNDVDSQVTLPQKVKTLRKGAASTIKLVEVGPRLTLSLVKIEAGLCAGEVLFHRFVEKSVEEAEEVRQRVEGKRELKRKRREEQEENVRRKKEAKRAKKERHKKNIEARLKAEREAEMKEDGGYEGESEGG